MFLLVTSVLLIVPSLLQGQTRDQLALATALREGSPAEKSEAVGQALAIAAKDRDQTLLAAVAQQLDAKYAVKLDRRRRLDAGEKLEPLPEEDDYSRQLLQIAGESADPLFVDGLCHFISRGSFVDDRLANFGEIAVDRVMAIATGSGPSEDRSDALYTLSRMIATKPRAPLSDASRQRIVAIATRNLTTRDEHAAVSTIYSSAEIAFALSDPQLIEKVRVLSERPEAVRALGLTDPTRVSLLQRLLRQKLVKKEPASGASVVGISWQYDVAPDGRFLINVNLGDAVTSPITVIQNWQAGIKK